MSDERRHVCLGFTNELYPEGTHMCYLYNEDEERRQVLPSYVRYGLKEKEAVEYIADVDARADLAQVVDYLELAQYFEAAADGAPLDGQFHIATALETFCPDGRFDTDRALDILRDMYARRQASGFAGSRATGEMSWAMRGDIPGTERALEFESRINDLVREVPVTVMCQYDARKFDGATIFEVINVHPVMMIHGHILRNPFYRPYEPAGRMQDVSRRRR